MEIQRKCIFSNKPADTAEHVIPRWLQRKFNLQNETYTLPNGTYLSYKNALAPALSEENGAFGSIEDKIANGKASDEEIYLWAFKIHVGLIYISSNLKFDIRDPKSPKFWDVDEFGKDVWLFQEIYKVWKNGGQTTPSPFGTVLRMKSLNPVDEFDFIHNLQSRTLFIKIGEEIIFVCFFDKGLVKRLGGREKFEEHRDALANDLYKREDEDEAERAHRPFHLQRIWACEMSYINYRISHKKFSFVISEKFIVSAISPLEKLRNENEKEFEVFCRSFGLNLIKYNKNGANLYSNITKDDHEKLVAENYFKYKLKQ